MSEPDQLTPQQQEHRREMETLLHEYPYRTAYTDFYLFQLIEALQTRVALLEKRLAQFRWCPRCGGQVLPLANMKRVLVCVRCKTNYDQEQFDKARQEEVSQ